MRSRLSAEISGPTDVLLSGQTENRLLLSQTGDRKMAEESFELKSNKYVLTLILNPSVPYQKMVSDIAAKFRRSARFFRGGQMAVQFRGRELTEVQETEIVDAITQNCQLDITCIIESDPDKEEQQKEAIVRAMTSVRENSYAKEPTAALVTRSLAAGERYSSLRPVVLLGDLQPGAEIISAGSILIWGTAMGVVRAGSEGDDTAFAAALVLKPSELSIASHRAVSAIRKKEITDDYPEKATVASVSDGHLKFEAVSAGAFRHLFRKAERTEEEKS